MEMSKLNGGYGFLSLLYSISENPLGLWSKEVSSNGCVRRVKDVGLNGDGVIEITGSEDCSVPTNISCPASPEDFLDIRLPILVIVIKGIDARVRIAFQLVDEENVRRKFFLSTCDDEKTSSIASDTVRISLKLDEGWNLLEIDLRNLCRTTCRAEYRALQRLIIYPNCRVRRIYLQDRHYEHNETPVELCQAFFDMYMLKWGIHLVETSCQTNEPLKQVKSDDKKIISVPNNSIYVGKSKNTKSRAFDKSTTSKNSRLSPAKGLTRKKKQPENDNAINANNKKIKFTEPEIRKIKISDDENREKNNFCETASIAVRMNDDSKTNEGEGKIFGKWPYDNENLQKMYNSESDKLKIYDSTNVNSKDSIVVGCLGKNFPERKSIRTRLSSASSAIIEKIPSAVVEAEATESKKNVESTKCQLLTTDEAIEKILELRHVVNKKMLENFRVRGLTMTEVELSIYNSKHRRNSYGQGKLVEKHRITVDKSCDVVSVDNVNA